jgi:TetR/AcrR family fatty acid metabolism transcriptional regulator
VPRLDAAQRQDRYEAILDAAEQVLARGGYAESSVGEVARLAGISDGLIYRYFNGKQDLRDQVLVRFYGRILARAQSAIAARRKFHERLLALVETHLAAFRDDQALCRLFIAEVRVAADYPGSPLQDLNRRYTSLLLRVLRQGVLEGAVSSHVDARLVRDMLYGGMEHVTWRSVNHRATLDVPATARAIVRLVLLGLLAGPE